MDTRWQQHYIRGILAIAVAMALPWTCIVHCAPHIQPQKRVYFLCDMFQAAATTPASQAHLTTNTPRPSAFHVGVGITLAQIFLHQQTTDYAALIVFFIGIVIPPTTHPPQHHPFFFSFV